MIPKTYDTARILIWEGCAESLSNRLESLIAEGFDIDDLLYNDLQRLCTAWRTKADEVRATLPEELRNAL